MPELPEVETTIRFLKPAMQDKRIVDFTTSNSGHTQLNIAEPELRKQLVGKALKDLSRVGKWMLFDFGDVKVIGHLRMSGRYKVEDKVVDDKHNRFQLHLDGGKVINYLDQRRFGTFELLDDFSQHKGLAALGPDAFSPALSPTYLLAKLARLKKNIYSALLDQTIIAGLGNIYVNEILHASGIHPLTAANKITQAQAKVVLQNMHQILDKALELKGTTLIDNLYQDPEGKTGEFARMLQVYGKKKDPDVQVLKVGGRSVFVHKHTLL